MIREQYVSFETAKLLKEKGFDETCRAFYKCWPLNPKLYHCDRSEMFDYCSNSSLSMYNYVGEEMNIAAPTQQMTIRWLREAYNIYIMIDKDFATTDGWHYYIATKEDWESSESKHIQQESNHYTYEEACETAIKYCLEKLI